MRLKPHVYRQKRRNKKELKPKRHWPKPGPDKLKKKKFGRWKKNLPKKGKRQKKPLPRLRRRELKPKRQQLKQKKFALNRRRPPKKQNELGWNKKQQKQKG